MIGFLLLKFFYLALKAAALNITTHTEKSFYFEGVLWCGIGTKGFTTICQSCCFKSQKLRYWSPWSQQLSPSLSLTTLSTCAYRKFASPPTSSIFLILTSFIKWVKFEFEFNWVGVGYDSFAVCTPRAATAWDPGSKWQVAIGFLVKRNSGFK